MAVSLPGATADSCFQWNHHGDGGGMVMGSNPLGREEGALVLEAYCTFNCPISGASLG